MKPNYGETIMKRVSIQPISGFPEFSPQRQLIINRFKDLIRKNFELHGFIPLETPAVERIEVLTAKGADDKEIYAVKRHEEGSSQTDTKLGLRFDLTVPLARYVAQHENELTFPFRRWQMQSVWRHERAQAGRFRQFEQCDIDVIGRRELSIYHDAEMPAIISSIFEEMEIGPFVIRINNRKVLQGLCQVFGITDENIPSVLRSIDKLEKIGQDGVVEDIVSNCQLDKDQTSRFVDFLKTVQVASTVETLKLLRSQSSKNHLFEQGLHELTEVVRGVQALGVSDNRFRVDVTIARGLGYYTGTVYETTLLNNPSLGSVCSGGRYDNLASYFTNEKLPGVGISIGLTRLMYGLFTAGVLDSACNTSAPVMVAVTSPETLASCLKIAKDVRRSGINTEIHYGGIKLSQQLSFANKKGYDVVVIIGQSELESSSVAVKKLSTGEQCVTGRDTVIPTIKKMLLR